MKIPEKLRKALNKQVNNELIASYTYMGLAAWCDANGYPGMAHWMKMQVQEEQFHVWKIYDFLINSGYDVQLIDIPAPKLDIEDPLGAFKAALDHEEMVTGNYYELQELALAEKAYAAQGLIQWFLSEQVEEEKNVQEVIDNILKMKDHPGAMMMLDGKLGTRPAPTPPAAE